MAQKSFYNFNSPLLSPAEQDKTLFASLAVFSALSTVIAGFYAVYAPVQTALFFLSVIVLAVIFLKPVVGYYLVIGFAAFTNIYFKISGGNENEHENILFFSPLILITYAAWLTHRIAKIQERATDNAINIFAIFFLLWASVSLFWSLDQHHGFFKLLDLIICIVTLQLPFLFIRDRQGVENSLKCFLIAGSIAALIVFISKWYDKVITSSLSESISFYLVIIQDKMRAGGIGPPDPAATVLNFFIFVGLAVLLTARSRLMRIASFALIVLLMVDVVMTGSKAAFGSMVMALFLLIGIIPSLRKRPFYYSCIAFSVVLFTFLAGALLATGGNLSKARVVASASSGTTSSLDSRLGWWSTGFEYLFKSDLIGIGIGGGEPLIQPVHTFHSLYFSVLFELGVVGIILFIAILIRMLYSFSKAVFAGREEKLYTISYCMIAGMFAFLVGSLVGGEFNVVQFWWQTGITLAVVSIAEMDGVRKGFHEAR